MAKTTKHHVIRGKIFWYHWRGNRHHHVILEWCARWGGATLFDMDRGENRRLQHRWTIVGQALRGLLKEIRPYLIIKADRAKWAAEGLNIISQPRKPYEKRNPEDVEKLYKLRQRFDEDRRRSLSARNRPKVVMP